MNFLPTDLPGVVLIEPDVYRDARGFFLETWHKRKYAEAASTAPSSRTTTPTPRAAP